LEAEADEAARRNPKATRSQDIVNNRLIRRGCTHGQEPSRKINDTTMKHEGFSFFFPFYTVTGEKTFLLLLLRVYNNNIRFRGVNVTWFIVVEGHGSVRTHSRPSVRNKAKEREKINEIIIPKKMNTIPTAL
jgi:hypothetical protein